MLAGPHQGVHTHQPTMLDLTLQVTSPSDLPTIPISSLTPTGDDHQVGYINTPNHTPVVPTNTDPDPGDNSIPSGEDSNCSGVIDTQPNTQSNTSEGEQSHPTVQPTQNQPHTPQFIHTPQGVSTQLDPVLETKTSRGGGGGSTSPVPTVRENSTTATPPPSQDSTPGEGGTTLQDGHPTVTPSKGEEREGTPSPPSEIRSMFPEKDQGGPPDPFLHLTHLGFASGFYKFPTPGPTDHPHSSPTSSQQRGGQYSREEHQQDPGEKILSFSLHNTCGDHPSDSGHPPGTQPPEKHPQISPIMGVTTTPQEKNTPLHRNVTLTSTIPQTWAPHTLILDLTRN